MAGRKVTTTQAGDPSPKKRRKVENREADRPGQFARLRGIFDQPTLWEYAATIPAQSPEGKRRKLPTIFYVAMPAFAAIWRSYSAAQVTLTEKDFWAPACKIMCDMQAKYRPQDEPFDLADLTAGRPLTAQNFYDARRTWLAPHLAGLQDIFEQYAAPLAREMGFADPDGAGSCNNLTRERTMAGDGKVTREPGSRYRVLQPGEERREVGITAKTHVWDRRTGDLICGNDMEGDAHLYMTGSGQAVGYKTVRMVVRSDDTNSSITLAVRRPATKDEAACAVQAAHDVRKRLPGMLALTYDAALRGTHIRALARDSRLVTIAPVTAKENSKGKRTEKSGKVADYLHTRGDGTECVHTFYHLAGQLCEERIDAKGSRTLIPCADPFVRFRSNKNGQHRQYLTWDVHCSAGLAPSSKPVEAGHLNWTVTDEDATFNVAENLRAIPPGSPRYADPHGWRQTIENDNHQSDARKVQGRGRSARPDWNHLNELSWAIMQNGVAIQRHRAKRNASQATAPPTETLPIAA